MLGEKIKQNLLMANFIQMFFNFVKHWMRDFEQGRKIKRIDKISQQYSTLEHLIIKLEKKIQMNRMEIEDLKKKLLFGQIINIALLLTIVGLIVL